MESYRIAAGVAPAAPISFIKGNCANLPPRGCPSFVCDVSGYHKFHEKSSLQEKDTGCILATYFCDIQVTRASAETEGFVSGIFVTFFVFTRPVRKVQRTFPCEDDRRETFEGGEYD